MEALVIDVEMLRLRKATGEPRRGLWGTRGNTKIGEEYASDVKFTEIDANHSD